MQAVPTVAPQSSAAALLLQAAPSLQVAGAEPALPALPQFDAVMAKAMLGLVQADQTVRTVQQTTTNAQIVMPVLSPLAAAPAPVLQPLPPDPIAAMAPTVPVPPPTTPDAPVTEAVATAAPTEVAAPDPTDSATALAALPLAALPAVVIASAAVASAAIAATDTAPAKMPVGTGTRDDAVDRQRPGRSSRREAVIDAPPPSSPAQPEAELSATLPILSVPAVPAVPAVTLPADTVQPAEIDVASARPAADPEQKRASPAPLALPLPATKPVEPLAAPSDGPAPVMRDATALAPEPLPVQAPPPTAPLPTVLLPLDAPQPATQSSAPATVPVSPTPTGHTTASPAAQIAPVLVSMAHAPDGAQRLTLRLDPPELGHVQIRIDRPPEAPARVEITVERAETLTLLLRDQPQLQRALDQAGVPPDGRSVAIHVAATEQAARTEGGPVPSQGAGSAGMGDASHGAFRQGGGPARQDTGNPDDTEVDFAQVVPPGWVRGGLDITA